MSKIDKNNSINRHKYTYSKSKEERNTSDGNNKNKNTNYHKIKNYHHILISDYPQNNYL
jgi:hypothetical protein